MLSRNIDVKYADTTLHQSVQLCNIMVYVCIYACV